MDRLSLIISIFTGAVATGALVVTALTLGYYNWYMIGAATAVGFILAWPLAYVISRKIKRDDPEFDHTRKDRHGPIPTPGAPEV